MEKIVFGRYYSPESRDKNIDVGLKFKAAQVNILASADQHGHLEKMHDFDVTIHNNFDRIFPKNTEKKGVANVFAVVGDWFVQAGCDDFITMNSPFTMGKSKDEKDKNKLDKFSIGDYELLFLNKIVDKIGEHIDKISKRTGVGQKEPRQVSGDDMAFEIMEKDPNISKDRGEVTDTKYRAILGLGNHCFENGDKCMLDLLKGASPNISTLISNANFENKGAQLLKDSSHVKEYTILEVEDDEKPDLKHKVLFISLTPNQLGLFCKDVAEKLNILDFSSEDKVDFEKLGNTFKKTFTLIEAFKKKNPSGAVVLLNHIGGNPASAEFVKRIKTYRDGLDSPDKDNVKIDLILNAHDHKNFYKAIDSDGKNIADENGNITENKEYVPVISLGEDNDFFRTVKLKFDNNGKLKVQFDKKEDHYKCDSKDKPVYGENLDNLFKDVLREDVKKIIHIILGENEEEEKKTEHITELGYKGVRWNFVPITNLLTDGILDNIRTKYDSETSLLAISSSFIRGGLPVNAKRASRYNIFNALCTNTPDGQSIYKVKDGMTGLDLIKFIAEYIAFDMEDPGRNAIAQWAGVKIDRDGLWGVINQILKKNKNIDKDNISDSIKVKTAKEFLPFIWIRDMETKKYEHINLEDEAKRYNVAIHKQLSLRFPIIKDYIKQGKFVPLVKPEDGVNPKARKHFYDYIERHKQVDGDGNVTYEIRIPNPFNDKRVETSQEKPEIVEKH